jgi:hypothetical protein
VQQSVSEPQDVHVLANRRLTIADDQYTPINRAT